MSRKKNGELSFLFNKINQFKEKVNQFPSIFQNYQAILVFFALMHLAAGYKILFLIPFNGKSHWILLERVIESLLERHHHVTAITNFKWNGPRPENYTEILIDPPLDFEKHSEIAFISSLKVYFKNHFVFVLFVFRITRASIPTVNRIAI